MIMIIIIDIQIKSASKAYERGRPAARAAPDHHRLGGERGHACVPDVFDHVCMHACVHACMHACVYIHIYIYIERERCICISI